MALIRTIHICIYIPPQNADDFKILSRFVVNRSFIAPFTKQFFFVSSEKISETSPKQSSVHEKCFLRIVCGSCVSALILFSCWCHYQRPRSRCAFWDIFGVKVYFRFPTCDDLSWWLTPVSTHSFGCFLGFCLFFSLTFLCVWTIMLFRREGSIVYNMALIYFYSSLLFIYIY